MQMKYQPKVGTFNKAVSSRYIQRVGDANVFIDIWVWLIGRFVDFVVTCI